MRAAAIASRQSFFMLSERQILKRLAGIVNQSLTTSAGSAFMA